MNVNLVIRISMRGKRSTQISNLSSIVKSFNEEHEKKFTEKQLLNEIGKQLGAAVVNLSATPGDIGLVGNWVNYVQMALNKISEKIKKEKKIIEEVRKKAYEKRCFECARYANIIGKTKNDKLKEVMRCVLRTQFHDIKKDDLENIIKMK